MESKFKFKLKQILILLAFVAVLIILNITLEFSPLANILVMVPFILLGCWFTYQNYKRRETEIKHSNKKDYS